MDKEIDIKQLKEELDYNLDTGIFTWKKSNNQCQIGAKAGTVNAKGYLSICFHQKVYRAHRLAWLYVYGYFPKCQIDHINHNKLDNSIYNLRIVSNEENHKNMPMQKNNTSGVTGVYFNKKNKKWRASIKCDGKQKHIGQFDSIEEASFYRKKAEYILGFHGNHGEKISEYNVGNSNYSKYLIQPWQVIFEYNLNYWDGDIIKRVLRTKYEPGMSYTESRKLDYEKIIHICKERIRQIEEGVCSMGDISNCNKLNQQH